MSEVSKSLIVTFDALNLVKGIKSIGGPDKQVYYIESDVFAPDRRITPLILQPYILVEDPHKIIASGDKVGELSSAKWYFDEIKSENRITAKEEDASMDTPFAMGVNNSLHIRKNVERATQLFFEAEYLDIRKNKNIHITLTYMLSTTQSSEVKPAPKLKLSKPQSWKYCPLDKITEATIEAEVFADNKGYKSAVEWCKVENNKEIPLTDEPFVLGGQNSNKLVVNPNVMGDTLLRARNLSEETYNRFYGINTEWDGRMSEVMENRNLITNQALINAGYEIDNSRVYGITNAVVDNNILPLKPLQGTCVLTYELKNVTSVNARFIALLNDGKKVDIFSNQTPYKIGNLKSLYLSYSSNGEFEIKKLKLEQGDKATPYTPAPEDLNYRNFVVNGDFRNGLKNWRGYRSFLTLKNNILQCEADGSGLNAYAINVLPSPTSRGVYYYYLTFSLNSKDCLEVKIRTPSGIVLAKSNDVATMGVKQMSATYELSSTYTSLEITHDYENQVIANGKILNLFRFEAINLTDKFGKGNEPNIQQCDEIFANYGYIPAPEDLAPSGIIKGSYQSDIKFTKYFPEINAEILFLTGDSIRPEHKTINAQAIFTTNKEPIDKPSEFFDIEWFIDPIEAGGVPKQIGTGEFMEIAVSELPLKGGRLVPIRLKYNFK